MTASNNVFALMDSITAQVYAVVVDAENPPALSSPNNAYWASCITVQTGNPIIAIVIPLATYNSATPSALASLLATLFTTLGNIIALV